MRLTGGQGAGGLVGQAASRERRPLSCMLLTQTGFRLDQASSRSALRMAGRRELRIELRIELRELAGRGSS